MFRDVRQCGFIPVLQSFGSAPLDQWGIKVKNGCIRRITDEQVRAMALELAGTNVSTCYVYTPKDPKRSLGIYMPFLVMIIKSLKKYFTFEITILDDRNVKRRFRMSNFQKMNRIHFFDTSMPLCLNPGWNEIYFDLADFTRKAYKTNYVETTRIQIHANCRIRVIYFCDRIYEDKLVPQKYKIFLPCDHVCRKKSAETLIEKKESTIVTDYGELEYGEEGEGEGMYPGESMRSLAAISAKVTQKVSQGIMSISEEGEYADYDYADNDEPQDGTNVQKETEGTTDAVNETADAENETADAENETADAGNETADAGNETADAGNEAVAAEA